MKIEGIYLDLVGNLVGDEIEKANQESHLLVLKEMGVDLSFEEALEAIPEFIGGPDSAVAKRGVDLAKKKTGNIYDVSDFLNSKRKHYYRKIKTMPMKSRPGVPEAIKWFQKEGLGVAIGTVTDKAEAMPILEKTKLIKLVGRKYIIFREDVSFPKPHPEVCIKCAEILGIPIKSMIGFEDSKGGVITVRNAGCLAIAMPVYNRPEILKGLIDAGAIRIFMDWREINFRALIDNLNQELKRTTKHF